MAETILSLPKFLELSRSLSLSRSLHRPQQSYFLVHTNRTGSHAPPRVLSEMLFPPCHKIEKEQRRPKKARGLAVKFPPRV